MGVCVYLRACERACVLACVRACMCACWLWLCSLGKYVSLFFVILKGEFDALLPRPYQQRVTIKLLDQSFISRGYAESYVATSDCTFQRPTASMNVAAGCPRFVAHEFLTSATNYIKDDTLYLKIDIDTTGPEKGRVWG